MPRMLYTLAIPELCEHDRLWIAGIRAQHDARTAALVEAHFTLVFGCDDIAACVYLAHVEAAAREAAPFEVVCRRAVLGTDHADDTGYAFLVPDEGNSALLRLHDRLHTGPLAAKLRLDLPFMPHMTVGRLRSLREAKTLCDDLNRTPICVRAPIAALSVAAVENDALEIIARYPLSTG
jgi:2'-5' RNA ligase